MIEFLQVNPGPRSLGFDSGVAHELGVTLDLVADELRELVRATRLP